MESIQNRIFRSTALYALYMSHGTPSNTMEMIHLIGNLRQLSADMAVLADDMDRCGYRCDYHGVMIDSVNLRRLVGRVETESTDLENYMNDMAQGVNS